MHDLIKHKQTLLGLLGWSVFLWVVMYVAIPERWFSSLLEASLGVIVAVVVLVSPVILSAILVVIELLEWGTDSN